MSAQRNWWKEAVAYQIYVKSFYDSDGDGIGDLRGIIEKLDYLQRLGVNLIWLTPVYRSPNYDGGYDISDYYSLSPEYGGMDDFEQLLAAAHHRGIKLIMDLVVNHTSIEHPWFQESRKGKDNPKRDFYIWREGKNGKPPNNWGSHFSGSAWTLDEDSGEYYLHLFAKEQPDLNWENPELRLAIFEMINWWLDKGIDGFRLDAINLISKVPGLPDNDPEHPLVLDRQGDTIFSLENFRNGPRLHEYLKALRTYSLNREQVLTVGECALLSVDDAAEFSSPAQQELDMTFLFEHTEHYNLIGKDPLELKKIIARWQTGLHGRGWVGIAFNNHDQPRVVSCFGDDQVFREESAKLFGTLLMTLEGTPFIYQGEEIGMTSSYYEQIEDYQDVATVQGYHERLARGEDPGAALAAVRQTSRDRGRSPFHWQAAANAGFSTGEPWIRLNSNYPDVNLESAQSDPDSVWHYYQQLIALRKNESVLVYGEFEVLPSPDLVFAYDRVLDTQRLRIILNLGDQPVAYASKGERILGNYAPSSEAVLRPYEARLLRLS